MKNNTLPIRTISYFKEGWRKRAALTNFLKRTVILPTLRDRKIISRLKIFSQSFTSESHLRGCIWVTHLTWRTQRDKIALGEKGGGFSFQIQKNFFKHLTSLVYSESKEGKRGREYRHKDPSRPQILSCSSISHTQIQDQKHAKYHIPTSQYKEVSAATPLM